MHFEISRLIFCSHPLSVDALCTLPSDLPNIDTQSTILTGSSDGLVRAVQILPTKLLGVVADHGEWAIERIAIGSGQCQLTLDTSEEKERKRASGNVPSEEIPVSRWWVGSAGHDGVLRMTDLEGFFREIKDGNNDQSGLGVNDQESDFNEGEGTLLQSVSAEPTVGKEDGHEESMGVMKRKRRHGNTSSTSTKKGKKNIIAVGGTFFDDL